MTDLLFTQPSASKEELQNACSFIQSECKCNRRPYDMFPVVCGGLRPLYSGSTTEAELLASINTLLSPPSPHDGTWSRLPSARYVPTAQQALFKCGGLDPLVTSLGFPSAVNRPAISRCIALAVGLQPTHVARAVELGALTSLADALSSTLKSGVFHNNCASFAMAIEALVDSSYKLQNDAAGAGLCVLIVNAILATIGGNGHEVVHTYFWAVAAMCRGNDRVTSSFARAGVPSAAVRALASCSKMLAAEAALDVLSIYTSPPEVLAATNSAGTSSFHELSSFPASSLTQLAVSALLTSDEAVSRLTAFARASTKHGKTGSVRIALTIMLTAATVDFDATASVLERTSSKGSSPNIGHAAVASSSSSLVQSCIASLMNDCFPHLCTQLLDTLVPVSVFACEVLNRGGLSVLLACLHSRRSLSTLKCSLSALGVLASNHQQQFILILESMPWSEISVAVEALLQRLHESRENGKFHDLLAGAVRLLRIFSSLPISFHFRMVSFMLSSKAIEIVLRCAISSHACSSPQLRGFILAALEFVLTLMDFDMSIKPVRDLKAASLSGFALDVGDYQSAASLVDVAPVIPDLLNLFASCISALGTASQSGNQGTQDVADVSPSISVNNEENRAILLCILRVLMFLVDNPLAADVTGAAGGVELLVKLFLLGEKEHKSIVLSVLRMLHAHNDMNRQILGRIIGKLPHTTKSLGKLLLKDHQPWLLSPSKAATNGLPSTVQGASDSSIATSSLPSANKSHVFVVQSDAQHGALPSHTRMLPRSHPVSHRTLKDPLSTTSHVPSSILPYLMAPLSKIFECYSSSDRLSTKGLRKFCHDFALKETHSRAVMRSYADISAAFGGELSLIKFVEAISVACSSLQLSLSQFLCEIGAKNARAVFMVIDAARERSLVHHRLEQTKKSVCLHVDAWKDRQVAKIRISEQDYQHLPLTAHVSGEKMLPKGRRVHDILSKDNDERASRSRSVQMQRKDQSLALQHTHQHAMHPERSHPSVEEAALWAEFGCMYAKRR